jgi:hypothetical protein
MFLASLAPATEQQGYCFLAIAGEQVLLERGMLGLSKS